MSHIRPIKYSIIVALITVLRSVVVVVDQSM